MLAGLLADPAALRRRVALLIAALSALVVGAAVLSEVVGGLAPCELCLWQRWPHYAAVPLLLASAALPGRPGAFLQMLGGLALLATAAVALFHVGVEQDWWAGLERCGGGQMPVGDPAALRRWLEAAPAVRCDEIAWTFLGLSMAAWNGLISLFLADLAFLTAARALMGPRPPVLTEEKPA